MNASPSTPSNKRQRIAPCVPVPSLAQIAADAALQKIHDLTKEYFWNLKEFLENDYSKAFAFAIMTPIKDCKNLWKTFGNIMLIVYRHNGVKEDDLLQYVAVENFNDCFGEKLLEKHGLNDGEKVQMTTEQMRDHYSELYRCSGKLVELLVVTPALLPDERKNVLRKVGAIARDFWRKAAKIRETEGLGDHVEKEYKTWVEKYGACTGDRLKDNIELC